MIDDREVSTHFHAHLTCDGDMSEEVQQFAVAADLCDDYGLHLAAELMRSAGGGGVTKREPKRSYGWNRSPISHWHFFSAVGMTGAICGTRVWRTDSSPVYFPWHGTLCQRCLKMLREAPHYKENNAAAVAAIEMTMAERERERTERQERAEKATRERRERESTHA